VGNLNDIAKDGYIDPELLLNLLLWTPWDRRYNENIHDINDDIKHEKCRDALSISKDKFIDKCFVEPMGSSNVKSVMKRLLDKISDPQHLPVIFTSYSGVGKSTLINAVIHKQEAFKDTILINVTLDYKLKDSDKWNKWLAKYCDGNGQKLYNKIIRLLLREIYFVLRITRTQESIEERKKHLEYITENYNNFFEEEFYETHKELICVLEKYVSGHLAYQSRNEDKACKDECYNKTYCNKECPDKPYCNNQCSNKPRNEKYYTKEAMDGLFACISNEVEHISEKPNEAPKKVIRSLFKALCVFLACETEGRGLACKRAIIFDNIEHYLDNDKIFDTEIQGLLDIFIGQGTQKTASLIKELNTKFRDLALPSRVVKGDNTMKFSDRFAVILVIREFNSIHRHKEYAEADTEKGENDKFIRLENYHLSLKEIIDKKCDFLNEIWDGFNSLELVKMVKEVVSDSGNRGALERSLLFFSYNKRRTVRAIVTSLTRGESEPRPLRCNSFGYFKKLRLVRRHIRDGDNKIASTDVLSAYYNGSRMLTARLLFDYTAYNREGMKIGGIFNELGMYDTNNQRGSARQILTTLSRQPMLKSSEIVPDHENPVMRLSILMKNLFLSPWEHDDEHLMSIDDNKLEDLAKKLWVMRDRQKEYRWAPLILLVLNDIDAKSWGDIFEVLKNVCKNPSCEISEDGRVICGAKPTFAGRFFLVHAPSFEFFAARFFDKSYALFTDKYVNDINACKTHIEQVQRKAFECIKAVNEEIKILLERGDCIYYMKLHSDDLQDSKKIESKYLHREFEFDMSKEKRWEHKSRELTHQERILVRHIRYIDDFRLVAIDRILHEFRSSLHKDGSPLYKHFTPINMAKIESKSDWNSKTFVNIALEQYHQEDEGCRCKIIEAVDMSKMLTTVLDGYIEELEKLTKIHCTNDKGFLIGNSIRKKELEWSDPKLGYKKLRKGLKEAQRYPLSRISIFSDKK